jgi:hypothetical protein
MKSSVALAICAAAMTAVPAASAAPISKTTMFTALGHKVTCGVMIHASSAPAKEVLCAAKGIPAPKKHGAGDPGFVEISVLGLPKVLRLSQNSFVAGSKAALGRGRLWNQLGVSCHVASTAVLCFNGDNHGFVIGDGKYRTF